MGKEKDKKIKSNAVKKKQYIRPEIRIIKMDKESVIDFIEEREEQDKKSRKI